MSILLWITIEMEYKIKCLKFILFFTNGRQKLTAKGLSILSMENFLYAKYTMVSRRRLVACDLVISSVVLLAVFIGFYEACRFFVVHIFLKLLAVFVGRHRSFSLLLLVVFSLFSSAVSEASVCRSCCFIVGHFLTALASRSCCFLAFLAVLLAVFSSLFFLFFFSKNVFWLSVSNWGTR